MKASLKGDTRMKANRTAAKQLNKKQTQKTEGQLQIRTNDKQTEQNKRKYRKHSKEGGKQAQNPTRLPSHHTADKNHSAFVSFSIELEVD